MHQPLRGTEHPPLNHQGQQQWLSAPRAFELAAAVPEPFSVISWLTGVPGMHIFEAVARPHCSLVHQSVMVVIALQPVASLALSGQELRQEAGHSTTAPLWDETSAAGLLLFSLPDSGRLMAS